MDVCIACPSHRLYGYMHRMYGLDYLCAIALPADYWQVGADAGGPTAKAEAAATRAGRGACVMLGLTAATYDHAPAAIESLDRGA